MYRAKSLQQKKIGQTIFWGLSAFFFISCASYTGKTQAGLQAYEHRDFVKAEEAYKEGAESDSVDQLLYLFDRGTVLHTEGKYQESIKDFLLADKLSEIKDYTNLATEVATIVTNDRIVQYKGEEFENVLVSAYLAMDFMLQGKYEDAIVECKRVNRKLERLRSEGKRDYRLNAFAQYLSGVLYEKIGNWNSAYVDYRKTYEIEPNFSFLRQDLIRGALQMDSDSELDRWKRNLNITGQEIRDAKSSLKTATLVVILQNGFAPEKVVSSVWHELPEYKKRYNRHSAAFVYVDGEKLGSTKILYDVEGAAFKNLESKYATYILKRVAGFAAREIIGNKVGDATGSDALGAITKMAMFIASKPDLRSWLTLPQNFQVFRAQVAPGKHHIVLRMMSITNQEEKEKDLGEIELAHPGSVEILNYRSLND